TVTVLGCLNCAWVSGLYILGPVAFTGQVLLAEAFRPAGLAAACFPDTLAGECGDAAAGSRARPMASEAAPATARPRPTQAQRRGRCTWSITTPSKTLPTGRGLPPGGASWRGPRPGGLLRRGLLPRGLPARGLPARSLLAGQPPS